MMRFDRLLSDWTACSLTPAHSLSLNCSQAGSFGQMRSHRWEPVLTNSGRFAFFGTIGRAFSEENRDLSLKIFGLALSGLLHVGPVFSHRDSRQMRRSWLLSHERPNHALELTSARSVFTFSMTTFFLPYLPLAVGGRSSACSR
jgi:hypothetical protein